MVNQAGGGGARHVRWRIIAVFVASAGILILFTIGLSTYLGRDIGRGEVGFFAWAASASLAVAYMLLRVVLGGPAVDGLVNRIMETLFGTPREQ